jgi:hypothetical protein
MKIEFSRRVLGKKIEMYVFMKIHPVKGEVFNADRKTDGRTERRTDGQT